KKLNYNCKNYLLRILLYTTLPIVALSICYWVCTYIQISGIFGLIVKGFVCVFISLFIFLMSTFRTKEFTLSKTLLTNAFKKKKNN
ncbi:MAG: hypothetical protein WCW63_04870, partial [Acholeplasmataceae bacterium]